MTCSKRETILAFEIGGQEFALGSEHVREVIPFVEPDAVTHQGASVLGVIRVRSETIIAVDLQSLLSAEKVATVSAKSCFVLAVLVEDAPVVALLVDRIRSSVGLPESGAMPAPTIGGIERTRYASGLLIHEERIVVILSGERILKLIEGEKSTMIPSRSHHE